MSDSIIIETFQTQVSHNSTSAHALVDALTEIQKKRKSHQLDIEIVCQRSQGIVTTEELNKAYQDFEIPNNGEGISNDILVGLIRGSLDSVSKESINIIAQARNDIAINDLVAINDLATIEGSIEEPTFDIQQEDPIMDLYYAQTPVGLSNIGNTCYLNSILQYIYTIKELRETVMNMEMYEEKENEEGWKEKVIDSRIFTRQDVAEAKELVQELRNLFSNMESEKSRSVTPSIRLVELLLPTRNHILADSSVPPEGDWTLQQQDITEALVSLMACFNAAFQPIVDKKDGKPVGRISRVFLTRAFRKGVEENETGAQTEWNINEDFECIIVAPGEDTTIEELVDDYFGETETDAAVSNTSASSGESQAGSKRRRDIIVTELPPILQIQLNQTQFYREVQSSYKSNANVSIPKRLFMDQYLEANQEQNADRIKRLKMWKADRRECRRVLEKIKEKRKRPATSNSSNADSETSKESMEAAGEQTETASDLQYDKINTTEIVISENTTQSSVDAATAHSTDGSYLNKEEAEQLRKITELTARLRNEIADMDQAEYKIHAVFHHSGNIDFGHYWVYLLDDQSEQPRWLKYSDDLVSEVAQESDALDGSLDSTICYCVYKRSSADAVQTVWRMIT
ncbi:hypothetical protein EDD21DRAFT_350815 [Dissophora ornata]|nr:hypothetical protein EDD21DRAFT_350815 [Dissophora ornata]